jgi:hypothetical protein
MVAAVYAATSEGSGTMVNSGTIITGIVLLLIGLFLSATIILAIIGIPLLFIGFILIIVGAVSSSPQTQTVYYPPAPVYYSPPLPPGSPSPVTVNVHQPAPVQLPPQIMRRCNYCNTVYPESALRCPSCGSAF